VHVLVLVHGYDALGNTTSVTQPDGSSGTILYNDTFGMPTHALDFNGNGTTYVLDSHGSVTQRTDPLGVSENYTYNSAGQVLTDTDPLGKTTTYVYDSLGRLTDIVEPGTTVGTLAYGYLCSGQPQLAEFFQIFGRRVAPFADRTRLKAA
jgi:YD repeat-containing protein